MQFSAAASVNKENIAPVSQQSDKAAQDGKKGKAVNQTPVDAQGDTEDDDEEEASLVNNGKHFTFVCLYTLLILIINISSILLLQGPAANKKNDAPQPKDVAPPNLNETSEGKQ